MTKSTPASKLTKPGLGPLTETFIGAFSVTTITESAPTLNASSSFSMNTFPTSRAGARPASALRSKRTCPTATPSWRISTSWDENSNRAELVSTANGWLLTDTIFMPWNSRSIGTCR